MRVREPGNPLCKSYQIEVNDCDCKDEEESAEDILDYIQRTEGTGKIFFIHLLYTYYIYTHYITIYYTLWMNYEKTLFGLNVFNKLQLLLCEHKKG